MQSTPSDVNLNPVAVVWEPTRACDLACLHCRSAVQPLRSNFELSTYEGYKLIDQIAALKPKQFLITGGDPLKRPDVFQYVDYARRRGLEPALTPSATPLLTDEAIERLRNAGLTHLTVSIDGDTAEVHDAFRGVPGSFDTSIKGVRKARSLGLPVQVTSMITRELLPRLDSMFDLLAGLDVESWTAFFLVPTGRGKYKEMLGAEDVETAFAKLYEFSGRAAFEIKTAEAPHYRRYALQQKLRVKGTDPVSLVDPSSGTIDPALCGDSLPELADDGKAFVFISHTGEVYPSGFLPLSGGNVRFRPLSDIYRHSPLFVSLRDSSRLAGKCGICEYRDLCGGSRARAYAVTGDALEAEPLCAYRPANS